MDSGKLDQRIVIQARTTSRNAIGEEVESWEEDGRPWARVVETPGREFLKGEVQAEGKAVFQIRYRTIDSTYRVLWGDVVYAIDAVTGTRRQGYRWLQCATFQEPAPEEPES